MISASRVIGALLCMALSSGCGNHAVTHTAPDESRPHYSWEIRSGGADERVVCTSAQPNTECVLQAGSRVTLHVAFHSTKQATTYTGQMTVPFIEGIGQGGVRDLNAVVPESGAPVNTSIDGEVIRQPGTYSFTLSVTAQQGGQSGPSLPSAAKVVVR